MDQVEEQSVKQPSEHEEPVKESSEKPDELVCERCNCVGHLTEDCGVKPVEE